MKKYLSLLSIATLLVAAHTVYASAASSVQCLGPQGKPVDWWVVFKVPEKSEPSTGGYDYYYLDANNQHFSYDQSKTTLASDNTPVGKTLDQVFSNEKTLNWAFYNDGNPHTKTYSNSYGHTKGVVAAGSKTGFWLVHSVPRFPESDTKYQYPNSGRIYGQSMLCMSLPAKEFNEVGEQLQYTHPRIFASHASASKTYPTFIDALEGKGLIKNPGHHIADLTTLGGKQFTSIVKSPPVPTDNAQFYSFVGNYFKQNMLVESWLRGSEEGDICPKIQSRVNDVQSLKFTADKKDPHAWIEHEDHAKWAIGTNKDSQLVCIGDLNRMTTQEKRGGGTVCFQNAPLHSALSQFITKEASCT